MIPIAINMEKILQSQIDYEDARFPDYDNEASYALYKALIITHKHNTGIVIVLPPALLVCWR